MAEERVVVAKAGARESLTIPLLNTTKTLLPAAQHPVMTQTKTAMATSDKTKMSRQNEAKVKSAKKPRPKNAESQCEEMSDIQSDPSHNLPFLPTLSDCTSSFKGKSREMLANLYIYLTIATNALLMNMLRKQ